MRYNLRINPCAKQPTVSLARGEKEILALKIEEQFILSESLLITIDALLKMKGILLKDIAAVEVNPGPGSYTSLRIALTVANLLAYSLNLPVSSGTAPKTKNFINPVMPIYISAPVITKRKPRL